MTALRIGLAGLGTVGGALARRLADEAGHLSRAAGRGLRLTAVSVRDPGRDRGLDLSAVSLEAEAAALAGRADVDVVVEAIGGAEGPARALVEAALSEGKPVVTANKALIATHGQRLAEAAEAAGVALRFEAAVAGGIPAIKALSEGLAANRMTRVFGVLNGTCNFILSEMEAQRAPYREVLAEAQALGYAEADPSMDVGGQDAAQKLAILAALAFGTRVDLGGVVTEGIERITLQDILTARDMGFSIKLLGLARLHEAGLEQRVRPCMVAETSAVGALKGVTNAVVAEGDMIGQCLFIGPGAGGGPTASAMLADLIDVAQGHVRPAFARPAAALTAAPRLAHGEEHSPYYLRVHLTDRPGALAQVALALGDAGVSIHRMRQYGQGEPVPVVIVTHDARRDAIDLALGRIGALPVCQAAPVAIRIEEV